MQLTNSLLHALIVADDQSYNGPTSPYYSAALMSVGAPLTEFKDGDSANLMPGGWQPDLAGWTVDKRYDESATGFGAVIYKKPSGDGTTFDYIVALQGTRGPNAQDWHGNLTYGWEKFVGAQGQELMNRLTGPDGILSTTHSIHFTGQSLGGALAQYVAYRYVDVRREFGRAINPSDMSLTTFNGLGGVEALSQNYQRDFGKSFNLSLLAGVATEHYWTTNDIVSRLVPNLNGAGNEYLLDFRKDARGSGPALSIADAHRIESGFYQGFNKFGGDFDIARPQDIVHLQIAGAAKLGTAWANLFNDGRTGEFEATARLISALQLAMAYGPPDQVAALTAAAIDHVYATGTISEAAYKEAKQNGADLARALAQSPLGLQTQARAWLLAQVANLVDRGDVSSIANDPSYADASIWVEQAFVAYGTELSNPDRVSLADAKTILASGAGQPKDAISFRAKAAAGILLADTALDPTTVSSVVWALVVSHKQELLDALKTARDGSLAFLTKLGEIAIAAQVSVGDAVAGGASWLYSVAADAASGATAYLVDQGKQISAAVENIFKSAGNAATDFLNKYAGATNTWAASLGDTLRRQLIGDFGKQFQGEGAQFGGAGATGSWDEFANGMAYAVNLGEIADQKLILHPGSGPNPFDATGGPGDVNATAPASINEKGSATFTIYLPYAAGKDGQRIRLQLTGSAAGAFDAVATSGLFPLGADGSFEIVIHEGQKQATFALAELRDVDASETLGLSATLLGSDGVPTHGQHLEVNLTLAAVDEGTQTDTLAGTPGDDRGSSGLASTAPNQLIDGLAGNDLIEVDHTGVRAIGGLGDDIRSHADGRFDDSAPKRTEWRSARRYAREHRYIGFVALPVRRSPFHAGCRPCPRDVDASNHVL